MAKSKIKQSIYRGEINTQRKTLQYYNDSVNLARNIRQPNRTQLIKLYYDLATDAHLTSVFNQRKTRITGLQYGIYLKSNKLDEKLTSILNDEWFYNFINMCMDSILYGNSLIEITSYNGEILSDLIPRENVIPEVQKIKTNSYSYDGDIDYTQPVYNSLIEVNNLNDKYNLGELLGLSKLLLFKNEVLTNYAQYIERTAQPVVNIKTDIQDAQEIEKLHLFAKNLGRAGYLITDNDTTFDFVANPQNNAEIYTQFLTFINTEISKHLLGSTMVTDDGSSYAQSLVHMQASYIITKSDIRNIEYIINNKLIKILSNLNIFPSKYLYFKFTEPEILTTTEKIALDTFLVETFGKDAIDKTYFENRYGITLKDVAPVEPMQPDTSMEDNMNDNME